MTVLQLDNARSCFDCVHYAMSNDAVSQCLLFNEPIVVETVAEDCEGYEP